MILDEIVVNGEIVETNRTRILAPVSLLRPAALLSRPPSAPSCMVWLAGGQCESRRLIVFCVQVRIIDKASKESLKAAMKPSK